MSLRKLWPPGGYRLTKKWKIEALKLELQALKAELAARKHSVLIPATIDSIEDQQKFLELIRLFKPVRVANIRKVRVGRSGDGGYVMLDCFDEIDAAFSFGVEQEISWDTEMAMRGCNVYMYDHSIDAPPQSNPRFHFFKKMIGPREDSSMGVESIENVLAKHGASGRRNVLKIDIEGAEWDAFDATEASILDRFSQIVCEFHGFENGVNDLWLARPCRCRS